MSSYKAHIVGEIETEYLNCDSCFIKGVWHFWCDIQVIREEGWVHWYIPHQSNISDTVIFWLLRRPSELHYRVIYIWCLVVNHFQVLSGLTHPATLNFRLWQVHQFCWWWNICDSINTHTNNLCSIYTTCCRTNQQLRDEWKSVSRRDYWEIEEDGVEH